MPLPAVPARRARRAPVRHAAADGRTYLDGRVQAVLFAAVHGDAAAVERYGITARTLRNYRAAVREGDTATARTFRAYAEALGAPGAGVAGCDPGDADGPHPARVETFAGFMEGRVRELVELFIEKAEHLNPDNPEALRALGEMCGRMLDHLVAVEYVGRLFGDAPRIGGPAG